MICFHGNGAVVTVILSPAGEGGVAAGNTGTKRKRSEPRDPNAPKRPCSAYIYFCAEMRPKLREEQPDLSMANRSKYIGKVWASLEAEKKKVRRMADVCGQLVPM